MIAYNLTLELALRLTMEDCQVHDYFPNSMGYSFEGGGTTDWDALASITGALSSGFYDLEDVEKYANVTDNFTQPPSTLDGEQSDTLRMIWKGQKSMGCYSISCGPGTDFFNSQVPAGNPGNVGWYAQTVCAFYPGKSFLFFPSLHLC